MSKDGLFLWVVFILLVAYVLYASINLMEADPALVAAVYGNFTVNEI